MKKIINGKRYDTDTATLIGGDCYSGSRGDFQWWSEDLYRTKSGKFFLAGEGGARSRWCQPYGSNGSQGGDGIVPLTVDGARAWAERHLSAEAVEATFTIEDA